MSDYSANTRVMRKCLSDSELEACSFPLVPFVINRLRDALGTTDHGTRIRRGALGLMIECYTLEDAPNAL